MPPERCPYIEYRRYMTYTVFIRDLYQSILYYHGSLTPYSDFYCAGFAVTASGIKNKFIEEVTKMVMKLYNFFNTVHKHHEFRI